jgi:hypothetical protein
MKKLILTGLVLISGVAAFAQYKGGSGSDVKPNVVKINALGFLFGNASVSLERALNEKSAAQINLSFGGLSVGGVKYTNFGVGADYRFYLGNTKAAPEGFYAAPGAGFYSLKVKEVGGTSVSSSGFVVKGVIGNQWIFNGSFALDLFGGINFYAGGKIKGSSGVEYTRYNGLLPAFGVALGYNF